MNNQIKPRQLTVGLALLGVLMLTSCGKKADEPVANAPENAAPTTTTNPAATGTSTTTSKPVLSAAAEKLGVKPTAETTCPANAPIKGKVTAKRGNIYHTAKSPDYAKVKPEICFKDTATAEKAGFKVPK